MRRSIRAGVLGTLVLATGAVALIWSPAEAACYRIPIVATTFDDIVVCTDPGEKADGTAAISLQGDARASGGLPLLAVSGSGVADRSIVCISGTGQAGGPDEQNGRLQCGASVSGTGEDAEWPDGSDRESSSAFLVAVSGRDTAKGTVAISVFGNSRAPVLSVSVFGEAQGHGWGQHPAPLMAVSGCKAEHSDHSEDGNGQILTADPERVHILADLGAVSDPQKEWEPTDIGTGELGRSVQSVTCSLATNQD